MKLCTKCKQEKPESAFSKNKNKPDGLQGICKGCCMAILASGKQHCPICDQDKDLSCFNKASKSPSGYFYYCRECVNIVYRQRREEFKAKHGISVYTQRNRERVAWIRSIKANQPCADCGKIYDPKCMDYDHLYGKVKSISRMVLANCPKETILKEIEKCDLVCILCHNRRTWNRQKHPDPSKFYATKRRNIEIIKEAKKAPCVYCGKIREEYNMQFDHIDPKDKIKQISGLKNYKTQTLLDELKKCQVVCALCHRIKSLDEQLEGKYDFEREEGTKKKYVGDGEQECVRCHQIKEFKEFHKHMKTASGYNSWCRDCVNEYRREARRASFVV